MVKAITLRPVMSEKAYSLSQAGNTYVFAVDKDINRQVIAKALAEQYKVTVASVRLASLPGRKRAIISRRRRLNREGWSAGQRKAYVTLRAGDKLPIFAAVEEAEKKEAEAEAKAAKKITKDTANLSTKLDVKEKK